MQDYTARPLPPLSPKMFLKLTSFIQKLENKVRRAAPPPFQVLRIGSAHWQSHALETAARLRLADHLGCAEELGARELAERGGLHAENLTRLLRLLSGLGVFEEVRPGVFRHTPASAVLRTDHPNCIRSMVLFHNHPFNYQAFSAMEETVRTGSNGLQLTGLGQDVFSVMEHNADYQQLFSAGMRAVDSFSVPVLVADYDYSKVRRIIDVGGATGTKSRAILAAHPHIEEVVVADFSHVVQKAEEAVVKEQVDPRVSFVACDLLGDEAENNDLPEGKANDLYLMVAVLHAFDDDNAVRALKTVRRAIGTTSEARVLVVDMVIEAAANELTGPSFDCMMMVTTQGKERTLSQFQALFQAAGFRLVQRVPARTIGGFLELEPV
jgi:ubiquinone/menaquinone biosynthesis C-methylase UbiE